jgi:hypothetical protein
MTAELLFFLSQNQSTILFSVAALGLMTDHMHLLVYSAPCTAYFVHLRADNLLLQANCFLYKRRPTTKHAKELEIFLTTSTSTYSSLHQVKVISSTSTFFNVAESHIGPTTFGDEFDMSMARLKESLAENILRALQKVFLPKHNSLAYKYGSQGCRKKKKMMWAPKHCAHVEARVDAQTSTIRTTNKAKLGDYKDKKTDQYGIDWIQGLLVFSAPRKYRAVKIARCSFEVVLRTTKYIVIYHSSAPSLEVIALRLRV